MDQAELDSQLRAARAQARNGQVHEARASLERIHRERPDCAEAAISLSRLTLSLGDAAGGETVLLRALGANPDHEILAVELAIARANRDDEKLAIQGLQTFVARTAASPLAWLLLGQMLDDRADRRNALLARFEALKHAQAAGVWQGPAATPNHLAGLVAAAVSDVHRHRHEIFAAILDPLRDAHGSAALQRVDRALAAYQQGSVPADPMQRPRFLYFPDLPSEPYLDADLQPWAPRLRAAFKEIRGEALSLIVEEHALEAFVKVKEGDRIDNYLGGLQPAWDAFFFYRHGERYDEHHARCPRTSDVLESLDLCRIPGQTPEICFSVLKPGTHILPHYGVTNTRLVMHLPLIVPNDCALQLVNRGTHYWKQGQLVMFDDTFLHEAWNRSDSVRVILLMDCWNPHLTFVERDAVTRLAQAIGALDVALDVDSWRTQ